MRNTAPPTADFHPVVVHPPGTPFTGLGTLAVGPRHVQQGRRRRALRIASPGNVPETSSVASPSVLPLPH
jgi:hypothetical protein